MTPEQAILWKSIRITPEKWPQHPWGDLGGGFWVVGIFGRTVIWYNDIEDGFNLSGYRPGNIIHEYICMQDELQWTLRRALSILTTGQDSGPVMGPPQPL